MRMGKKEKKGWGGTREKQPSGDEDGRSGGEGEEPRSSLPGESCLHLRIPNRLAEESSHTLHRPRLIQGTSKEKMNG